MGSPKLPSDQVFNYSHRIVSIFYIQNLLSNAQCRLFRHQWYPGANQFPLMTRLVNHTRDFTGARSAIVRSIGNIFEKQKQMVIDIDAERIAGKWQYRLSGICGEATIDAESGADLMLDLPDGMLIALLLPAEDSKVFQLFT